MGELFEQSESEVINMPVDELQSSAHGGHEVSEPVKTRSVPSDNITPQNTVDNVNTYQKAHKLDLASLRPKECTFEMSNIDFRAWASRVRTYFKMASYDSEAVMAILPSFTPVKVQGKILNISEIGGSS